MNPIESSPLSVVASVAPLVYLAAVKDKEYVRILSDSLKEILQLDFPFGIGHRNAMKFTNEIEAFSRLVYYYSMYCLGDRTLGQAYVRNIPIVMNDSNSPSPINNNKRLMLVLGQSLLPYFSQVMTHISFSRRLVSNGNGVRSYLLKLLQWVTSPALINWLSRAHLALFFINSRYADIWLRICRVRFVRNAKDKRGPDANYTGLGLLLSIELIGVAIQEVSRWWATENEINKVDDGEAEAEEAGTQGDVTLTGNVSKCSLCMCPRKNTSATECGHLFCWECIIKWCRASKTGSAECPLCRQLVQPQKILMLQY